MQSKSTLINSNQTWNAKKRYKINEIVTHLGVVYQNISGVNTDPTLETDWKPQVDDASPYTLPYKTYVALLSQSGTNDPVVTVLENTIGGTVLWTRASAGVYYASLTGASYTSDKTTSSFTLGEVSTFSSPITSQIYRLSNNIVNLITYRGAAVLSDDSIGTVSGKATVEIRVYP